MKRPLNLSDPKDRNAFYNSREWRELREYILSLNPLCVSCKEKDRLVPATEIDHIIPISADPSKRLDINNLQPLCKSCHSEKTYREVLAPLKEKKIPYKKIWKL